MWVLRDIWHLWKIEIRRCLMFIGIKSDIRNDARDTKGKQTHCSVQRVIIHSWQRREPSCQHIRLVIMHHVTLHAVKQGYQFAVHASLMRVAWCVVSVDGPFFPAIRVYIHMNKSSRKSTRRPRNFVMIIPCLFHSLILCLIPKLLHYSRLIPFREFLNN